jgi:hypothetical protein
MESSLDYPAKENPEKLVDNQRMFSKNRATMSATPQSLKSD